MNNKIKKKSPLQFGWVTAARKKAKEEQEAK